MFDPEIPSTNDNKFKFLHSLRCMLSKVNHLLLEKCDLKWGLLNKVFKKDASHAAGHEDNRVHQNTAAPQYFGDDDDNTSTDSKS